MGAKVKEVEKPIVDEIVDEVKGEEQKLVSMKAYIGKESDFVTRALLARRDCQSFPSCVITNVVASEKTEGNLTIVVNKNIPQYILNNETGEYEMSTTKNVFSSTIQLAALLKGQGEMLLAKAMVDGNINIILAILKGARISVIAHEIAAGEDFVNPYATREPSEYTATDRNRIQYFPYEITLADKSSIMMEVQLAKMLSA